MVTLEKREIQTHVEKQQKPQALDTLLGRCCFKKKSCLAFDDLAGLDAARADAHAPAGAVDLGLHRLQVHVPAAAGGVVGVGDVVSKLRTLAAEITFLCHDCVAPISYRRNFQTVGTPNAILGREVPVGEVVGTSGFEPLTSTASTCVL